MYQILGSKHQNQLLVIVSSNCTSALFAFSISRYPPETISDLTVVAVYAIDDSFWINPGKYQLLEGYQCALPFLLISLIGTVRIVLILPKATFISYISGVLC